MEPHVDANLLHRDLALRRQHRPRAAGAARSSPTSGAVSSPVTPCSDPACRSQPPRAPVVPAPVQRRPRRGVGRQSAPSGSAQPQANGAEAFPGRDVPGCVSRPASLGLRTATGSQPLISAASDNRRAWNAWTCSRVPPPPPFHGQAGPVRQRRRFSAYRCSCAQGRSSATSCG